ncbi:hypothetical protein ElyMa_003545500 [Elysia marginata]|uniref:Uncharacterized protein n=1 Tax=Elysia marginata TaxID=1093978 RepID=A0AAV4EKE4_9GAST|nr:hypothetical protein ElyMa_003545500 [Elysia marginata]
MNYSTEDVPGREANVFPASTMTSPPTSVATFTSVVVVSRSSRKARSFCHKAYPLLHIRPLVRRAQPSRKLLARCSTEVSRRIANYQARVMSEFVVTGSRE